mgnify:CR=1 FL=1
MKEADQRAEQGQAGDEGFGAVDRVEHPDILGVGPDGAMLFAEHAVLGHMALEQVAHRRLGLAVGDGDRAVVGLVVDGDLGAKVAGRDRRAITCLLTRLAKGLALISG